MTRGLSAPGLWTRGGNWRRWLHRNPACVTSYRTMVQGGRAADQETRLFIEGVTCARSERSRRTQRRDSIREVWLHRMDRRGACPQRGLPKNDNSGPRPPPEVAQQGAKRTGERGTAVALALTPSRASRQSESRRDQQRQQDRRRRETVSRHKRVFAIGSEQDLVGFQGCSLDGRGESRVVM